MVSGDRTFKIVQKHRHFHKLITYANFDVTHARTCVCLATPHTFSAFSDTMQFGESLEFEQLLFQTNILAVLTSSPNYFFSKTPAARLEVSFT